MSAKTFAERGGVSGIIDVVLGKSLGDLANSVEMKPEGINHIFSGDVEKAEAALTGGLLLAIGDADHVLTEPVVVKRSVVELEARSEPDEAAGIG